MEIKDVLKNFREENKISQREFSRRSGLSNSLISILEMGVNPQTGKKMKPDIETYIKIADAMGITLGELFEMIKDSDASVTLIPYPKADADPTPAEGVPKTYEAKVISGGVDRLPKEQREQALKMLRVMFAPQYAGLFSKGEDDDDT